MHNIYTCVLYYLLYDDYMQKQQNEEEWFSSFRLIAETVPLRATVVLMWPAMKMHLTPLLHTMLYTCTSSLNDFRVYVCL